MRNLFEKSRLLGGYFCTNRERLRELARQRGVHHLDNLAAASLVLFVGVRPHW